MVLKEKLKVAVLFGGYSSEREISIASGLNVLSFIDKQKFDVYPILIDNQIWKEYKTDNLIDKSDFSLHRDGQKINFDVVVNVIHGTPGENGLLQAYFDLLNVPYTGCSSFASSLTFNKFYCNRFLEDTVSIADSVLVRNREFKGTDIKQIIDKLGLPVFVKPSAGGSSFGTTKVLIKEQMQKAIENAFVENDEVIIEEFIAGREFTCAVYKSFGKIRAMTPVEIITENEFFDYEAKYNPSLNKEVIPPDIQEDIVLLIKKTSEKIYHKLNCNGVVRIDYIWTGKELYFLELNSIPGMTENSIVPKIFAYEKINLTKLYEEMITVALFG